MLTASQKILKFLILLIVFSILTGLIAHLVNYAESIVFKDSGRYYGLNLISNLLAAGIIIFIICVLYYLSKLIAKARNSATRAGIVVLLLAYIVFTIFKFIFSIGPFNPFEGEYILSILLRFGVIFFMPHLDWYLTKRMVTIHPRKT